MDNIKIIDLFAGIGGIRLGFERAAKQFEVKTECVFSSEIEKHACITYRKNYPHDDHNPENDITKVKEVDLPDFDVLLAGFPCQAFSIAGKKGGFEDTRGTLFFDVARIIKQKRPSAFLLENVKGLVNHNSGRTLNTILNVLQCDLGYTTTEWALLNSKNFGVPQNRERIYIVGFREGGGSFQFPSARGKSSVIGDIVEENTVSVKYYLSDTYLKSLIAHRKRHESKGNGFGYEVRSFSDIANAIVVGGMGKERNLLEDRRLKDFTPITHIKGSVNREGIRRMTPLEWERLQGFPDNYTAEIADVHRYKQLGNSVSVPVITALSENIIKELLNPEPSKKELFQQTSLAFSATDAK